MHDDTIKPPPLRFRITPELRPVLYFIVGCGVCVLGFDVYYMLYIHEPALNTLTEDKFRKFKLREITQVSPTTSLFSFAALIPDAQRMVIPSHIVVKDDTCQIARSYTPISYSNNQFDILVRKYEQGSVSKFIHALTPGDRVEMRGPIQTFPYKRDMAQHIGMVAGGTGITPMYQLIKRIVRDPDDHTHISLVYANRTQDEILLKNELDYLALTHPDQLRIYYVLDNPPSNNGGGVSSDYWSQGKGRLTSSMIKSNLPAPSPDTFVFVCGPDGMVRHVAGDKIGYDQGHLGGILGQLNYAQDKVWKF